MRRVHLQATSKNVGRCGLERHLEEVTDSHAADTVVSGHLDAIFSRVADGHARVHRWTATVGDYAVPGIGRVPAVLLWC
jgi:hypothetical protein